MADRTKILFVASNPQRMQLDFAQELDLIQRAGEGEGGYQVIARWSVSLAELARLLKTTQPDVVHLLSPGVEQDTQLMYLGEDGESPERISPAALAKVFKGLASPPKLVVLNTCHSGAHAEELAAHVGCAIAMRGLVMDDAAIRFADSFYRSAVAGDSVRTAFDSARRTVRKQHPGDEGDPALYTGRSDPADINIGSAKKRASAITASTPKAVRIFCSYSHKDSKYRAELETFLAGLKMQGLVNIWHDRLIKPGTDWAKDINSNLDHANLVLLLVSSDFIASQYCMGIELKNALARQQKEDVRIVPILIRECDLAGTPLTKLQWLPTGAKPVKKWSDRDSAWTDVAKNLRKTVEEMVAANRI